MRFFEMVIVLLTVITTMLYLIKSFKNKTWIAYISGVNLLGLIVHSFYEGIRWQLYPIYSLIIVYFIISCYKIIVKKNLNLAADRNIMKSIALTLAFMSIIISCAALYAFPMKSIIKPSGLYSVGTQSYQLEDFTRDEIYGDASGDKRKIMIQVWYPAKNTSGLKRAPWIEHGKAAAPNIARAMHLPSFVLAHTAYIMSNSYESAELSDDIRQYPVIIISHGWTGFRDLHTDLAEELASNGYIVVAIDHTYGSSSVVFENGSTVNLDSSALPERSKNPDFLEYAYKLVSTFSDDIRLVIDELEKWNSGEEDSPFKDRMNLDKLGVIGHSTGGGAAIKASMTDYRIKAVIGLDAWVESFKEEDLQQGLGVPALFFRSEQWQNSLNNKNLTRIVANSRSDNYFYQIQGTSHLDFTMLYMISPLIKPLGYSGSLDSTLGSQLLKEYADSFFNEYLLNENGGETEKLQQKYEMVKLLQKAKIIQRENQ